MSTIILNKLENNKDNTIELITRYSDELISFINDYVENENDNSKLIAFLTNITRIFFSFNKSNILKNSLVLSKIEMLARNGSLTGDLVKFGFRLNFSYPFKIQLDSFKSHFSNSEDFKFERTVIESIEKSDLTVLVSLEDKFKSNIGKIILKNREGNHIPV